MPRCTELAPESDGRGQDGCTSRRAHKILLADHAPDKRRGLYAKVACERITAARSREPTRGVAAWAHARTERPGVRLLQRRVRQRTRPAWAASEIRRRGGEGIRPRC